MSFPRYPSLQATEVAWARFLPMHWAVKSARRLFSQERDPSLPADEQLSATQKYGVVPQRLFMDLEDQKVALALSGMTGFKHVMEGDFVISLRSFQGGIEYSAYTGCVSPAYTVLRPSLAVERAYFRYLLKSQGFIATLQSMTDGLRDGKAVSYQQFGQLRLPVPPSNEQASIANFLDRETAKIDALIAEQERLIELLREKRQAVISHAVTKGLNPDVPVKPSGVEWLGDVPAHWIIKRIAQVSTKITNGYVGPTRDILVDEGVRYLQSLHIKNNAIRFDVPYFVTAEWSQRHSKSILEAGDVLIVQTGDIGQVAVVSEEFTGCNCHALIIVAPVRNYIFGDWLAWVLNSDYGFHSLLSIQTGALHPHLNCGNVRDISIPVPPMAEQVTIVRSILHQLSEIDGLALEAERTIGLLRERRSALISAAVTGQIDVRGLVEQEVA